MGFLGGSDSYTGRPGYDRPGHQERRYAKNGLTALYARSLTLPDVLSAMKARSCYATTGARVLVSGDADGHMLGSEYVTSAHPRIRMSVDGTAPIETVELFRGLEKIYTHDMQAARSSHRVRVTWNGASRESSYSGVIWDGRVNVSNGAIQSIEKIRFDSPRSHVFDESAEGCSWHSWTCGYRSGLVLEVGEDAVIDLALHTRSLFSIQLGGGDKRAQNIAASTQERVSLSVSLKDLQAGPRHIDLGPVNRSLTIDLDPEDLPLHVDFELTDVDVRPGINPYWLRVRQRDGEAAWTSPVFVDYVADPMSSGIECGRKWHRSMH